jgi:hypothetical protein
VHHPQKSPALNLSPIPRSFLDLSGTPHPFPIPIPLRTLTLPLHNQDISRLPLSGLPPFIFPPYFPFSISQFPNPNPFPSFLLSSTPPSVHTFKAPRSPPFPNIPFPHFPQFCQLPNPFCQFQTLFNFAFPTPFPAQFFRSSPRFCQPSTARRAYAARLCPLVLVYP